MGNPRLERRRMIYRPRHLCTIKLDPHPSQNKKSLKVLPPREHSFEFITLTVSAPSPPPDITPSLFTSIPPSAASLPKPRPDPTPVILFGFPPSHAPLILREYERYGPILEHFHSISPAPQATSPLDIQTGGNWIRITYADPVSAARAVGTNGQIFGGAYMIGVMYAPKQEVERPVTAPESVKEEEVARTPGGERKMNVVRGGERMFVNKKEGTKTAVVASESWGTWAWNQVFGGSGEKPQGQIGGVVVAGGGQSNVVVRALRGVSETVFGF
jgi:Nup53/35/40-type RNA recognition motif